MNKKISIHVAETGKYSDAEISRGTTVGDIRNHLGLSDSYELSDKDTGKRYQDSDEIYDVVHDGQKLTAASRVEVGEGA